MLLGSLQRPPSQTAPTRSRPHPPPHLCPRPLSPLAVAQRIPERIIEKAVKGMLPKGSLGRDIRLHLKVYKGTAHPHEAQQPVDITQEISIKPKLGPGKELLAAAKKA